MINLKATFMFTYILFSIHQWNCFVLKDLPKHQVDNIQKAFLTKLGLHRTDKWIDSSANNIKGNTDQQYIHHLYNILEQLPDYIGEISIYSLQRSGNFLKFYVYISY